MKILRRLGLFALPAAVIFTYGVLPQIVASFSSPVS